MLPMILFTIFGWVLGILLLLFPLSFLQIIFSGQRWLVNRFPELADTTAKDFLTTLYESPDVFETRFAGVVSNSRFGGGFLLFCAVLLSCKLFGYR